MRDLRDPNLEVDVDHVYKRRRRYEVLEGLSAVHSLEPTHMSTFRKVVVNIYVLCSTTLLIPFFPSAVVAFVFKTCAI